MHKLYSFWWILRNSWVGEYIHMWILRVRQYGRQKIFIFSWKVRFDMVHVFITLKKFFFYFLVPLNGCVANTLVGHKWYTALTACSNRYKFQVVKNFKYIKNEINQNCVKFQCKRKTCNKNVFFKGQYIHIRMFLYFSACKSVTFR